MANKSTSKIQWIPENFVFGTFGSENKKSHSVDHRGEFYNRNYKKHEKPNELTPPWVSALRNGPQNFIPQTSGFAEYAQAKMKNCAFTTLDKSRSPTSTGTGRHKFLRKQQNLLEQNMLNSIK